MEDLESSSSSLSITITCGSMTFFSLASTAIGVEGLDEALGDAELKFSPILEVLVEDAAKLL